MRNSERSRAGSILGLAGLVAAGSTFVILYFQLAKSSRFPPDDLCQFSDVRALGMWGTQLRLYRTWSGRWASNLLATTVFATGSGTWSLFCHALALLGLGAATALLTVRAVVSDRISTKVHPILALVTVALIFFATPNRGDSWFFAGSSVENLVPICCGAIALACVLLSNPRRWLVVPGAIAGAIAGGGHECVTLTWLSVGYALLAWAVVRARAGAARGASFASAEPRMRTAAIVLAVATVSFALCVASPGASVRGAVLHHLPIGVAIARTLTGGPQLLVEVVRGCLPVLAATVLVWAWAAHRFACAGVHASATEVVRVALALVALALLVGVATALPGYYALGAAPPTRAQLALAVYLVGAAATLGAQLGRWLRGAASSGPVLVVSMLALVAVVFQRERALLIPEIAAARIYARAYDARMATLRQAAARDERAPVVVDSLPASGVLRSAEISTDDTKAYANRCLAQAMGLRRGVLCVPDSPG